MRCVIFLRVSINEHAEKDLTEEGFSIATSPFGRCFAVAASSCLDHRELGRDSLGTLCRRHPGRVLGSERPPQGTSPHRLRCARRHGHARRSYL